MRFLKHWYVIVAFVAILGISLGFIVPTLSSHYVHADIHVKGRATTPIQHVVVIMLENHSFDTMFGRFPGVNGITLPRASNPFTSDSVKYKSPTNTAPKVAELDIDGIPHALQGNGTNYQKGVTYTYTTANLSIGIHTSVFALTTARALAFMKDWRNQSLLP